MKILVTGSAGHLGEALIRTLKKTGDQPIGLDIKPSEYTDCVGSIADRGFVRECIAAADAVIHAATLHKPHVGTHSRQDFIDTNISGTLNLLEEAVANDCQSFIFTSTTSTFGDAMRPAAGEPAVWVTEELPPKSKNIYGVTKSAAEDLCRLFHRNTGLPCLVLKTSRFFPEDDDQKDQRDAFDGDNLKVNELLFRRADIDDIVAAHRLALDKAKAIGFDRFIVSATPPFKIDDAAQLGTDAAAVVQRYVPEYVDEYARRNWQMFPTIGRVYDNTRARTLLGWEPQYTFQYAIRCLRAGEDYRSPLAREIGSKGYHEDEFEEGPYPVQGF
ncbi:MAG: NAD(P)-dependent oxidoreductase [Wenzhouxiangellaceae bacterium]